MKVNEFRNILDIMDGEADIVVALKSQYGDLIRYDIAQVSEESILEEKEDFVLPVVIWLDDK